jgi:hypothetical protein
MQISVHLFTGNTITVDVDPTDTIEQVIAKIVDQEDFDVPASNLLVWFNDEELKQDKKLSDYSIQEGYEIMLVFGCGDLTILSDTESESDEGFEVDIVCMRSGELTHMPITIYKSYTMDRLKEAIAHVTHPAITMEDIKHLIHRAPHGELSFIEKMKEGTVADYQFGDGHSVCVFTEDVVVVRLQLIHEMGQDKTLLFDVDNTVLEMKEYIAQRIEVSPNRIEIFHTPHSLSSRRVLIDGTVGSNNIQDDDFLFVLVLP